MASYGKMPYNTTTTKVQRWQELRTIPAVFLHESLPPLSYVGSSNARKPSKLPNSYVQSVPSHGGHSSRRRRDQISKSNTREVVTSPASGAHIDRLTSLLVDSLVVSYRSFVIAAPLLNRDAGIGGAL